LEPEKASRMVKLALMGSAALVIGYFTCRQSGGDATTRPSGSNGGSHWYGGGWHGSGLYGGYGGSTAGHSFSSRGGFGSTGHAAGA
jgi:hypothetical protein